MHLNRFFCVSIAFGGIYVAVQSLENKGGGAMKRLFTATVLILSTVILSSCGYGMPIENLNFPLVLGFDLDEDNHLLFYTSSPVFNKYADEKADIIKVKAKAIRESRKYFDALETGDVTSAKIQIFLIGKKILEQENWFSILDTVYRNPNFSGTTKMVMVDGSVEDVIFHKSKTKPQLSLFLNDLIDNNVKRTRNVKSMAHIFHREMYDKGITPVIPRLVKDKEIKLMGLALLNNKGKYVDKLSIEETSLLLLLRNQKDKELTLSTMLHQVADEGGIFNKNEVSYVVERYKGKIKTKYEKGKFRFDYDMKMYVSIDERLFPPGQITQKQLEQSIKEDLTSRFEELIKKFQKHKVDPIGLGVYARAYHYKPFKKVADHWPEAFADADVHISLDVEISSMGAIK